MRIYRNRLLLTIRYVLPLLAVFNAAGIKADQQQKDDQPMRGNPGERVFSVHDDNRDGLISRAEYLRFVEHRRNRQEPRKRAYMPPLRFDQIDTDDDGYINKDEMIQALNTHLKQHRRYRYRGGRE